MKIVNINGKKSSYLLKDFGNFKEILRKNVTYDNIKSNKKPGLHPLSLEDTFFEKPEWDPIDSISFYHLRKRFFITYLLEQFIIVHDCTFL